MVSQTLLLTRQQKDGILLQGKAQPQILRLAEAERHIYCVIDGMTRYQYVSLSKLVPPPQPKPPPTDETESP